MAAFVTFFNYLSASAAPLLLCFFMPTPAALQRHSFAFLHQPFFLLCLTGARKAA
jgi:hypothetical protein